MIATTTAVAPSRVLSMAPKTLMRSARMPAGPVTLMRRSVTCEAAPRTASVMPAMASSPFARFSCALSLLSETLMRTALPSCAGIGTIGPGSRKSATLVPGSTSRSGISPAKVVASARSAGLRTAPSGRVMTTSSGKDVSSLKSDCSLATRVDSADAGRNDALSFVWTSLSFPARGPATLPKMSHSTATPIASHTAFLPGVDERVRLRSSSVEVMSLPCQKPMLLPRTAAAIGEYSVACAHSDSLSVVSAVACPSSDPR